MEHAEVRDSPSQQELTSLEESGCNLRLVAELGWELRQVRTGSFLDIGCGTGILAHVLSAFTGLTACGTERSVHAYRLASRRITCHLVSGNDLPFDDGTFNAVIANNVMMLIEPKKRLFEEVHRVLRGGGRFLTVMPDTADYAQKPLYAFIPGSLQSSMRAYGTVEETLAGLRRAGFTRLWRRRITLGTVEMGNRYVRRHRSGYFSNSQGLSLEAERSAGLIRFAAGATGLTALGIRMHYEWERTLIAGERT